MRGGLQMLISADVTFETYQSVSLIACSTLVKRVALFIFFRKLS